MKPGRDLLRAMIEDCGIRLEPGQYDKLWEYHRLLRAANAELNLTRIHNFENMVLKHYVDSLLVLRFTELPSPLIDMGSGPGLPGIPLKIARPDVEMILAEPRGARAEFLSEACRRLGLDGVEVYAGKIGPKVHRAAAGVITRAVATIPETLDRVVNCIRPGGRMLFMKGPDCDLEIKEAARDQAETFKLEADHAYKIPGTTHDRRLVIYERLEGQKTMYDASGVPIPAYTGTIREVASASNPTFKLCKDLLGGRGIRKNGQALIAGARPIAEVLEKSPGSAEGWLTDSKGNPPPRQDLPWIRFADPLFRELDMAGTHTPLLLVKLPEMPEWSDDLAWPAGCTLFVPFQDPENVGAVLRSAAAFGAKRAVLLREAAHPFHPKSARAAGPALFQIPLLTGPSIQDLTTSRIPLVALSMEGPELGEAPFPETFGLLPGVEGPGLPARFREGERRRIPIQIGTESLNAATATAIALYSWSQERRKP